MLYDPKNCWLPSLDLVFLILLMSQQVETSQDLAQLTEQDVKA